MIICKNVFGAQPSDGNLVSLIYAYYQGMSDRRSFDRRSRSLNFAIAIVLRYFDQMEIADRDLDREKKIAIDDQKIADHSYLSQMLRMIFLPP